jgi:Big-like domain-containing protein
MLSRMWRGGAQAPPDVERTARVHPFATFRRRFRLLVGTVLPSAGLVLAFGLGAGLPASDAFIATHRAGYVMVAKDGGVFNFGGAAYHGSTGNLLGPSPIIGVASRPSLDGYWTAAADGTVFAFGSAKFYGPTGGLHPNHPIVGITATPTGKGYWMVADDGGVFSFGDATFHGSTGNIHLARPVVGITATPTGDGYWMVADDGGVFSFGDATFQGSTGDLRINSPIVGIVATAAVNDPPSLTLSSGLNGSVSKTGTLSGSGSASDPDGVVRKVQVSVDGGSFSTTNVTCTNCGHGTATWTWAATLSEGSHQLSFRSVDDGGAVSTTSTATVRADGTAPTIHIIASPAGGYSATAKPSISGSAADSGGSGVKNVTVSIDGGSFSGAAVTCTGCGSTSASWSFTAASNLSEGSHTISFRSTDVAGNVSASTSRTITVDTVDPDPPAIVTFPTVNLANTTAVAVSGTSEAGATINLTVTDAGSAHTVLASGTADGSGNWTIAGIDVSTLTDGTISATATATDAAGNVSISSAAITPSKDTVAPAAPDVTIPTVNVANKTAVTVDGTSEPDATISLTVTDAGSAHTVLASGTADGAGDWEITGIDLSTLTDGTISATATATDAAGNTSDNSSLSIATKDTVVPDVVVSSADTANAANENSVPVSGTVETGGAVSVVASDGNGHSTAPANAGVTGTNWSVNIDVQALDDATITYTATATDLYGNTNVDSETAVKDTEGPALNAVAGLNGSAVLTLTFDEPVLCTSVSAGAFVVTVNNGLPEVGVLAGCTGSSSDTLTLTLLLPLSTGNDVDVVIGLSTITDSYGNASIQLHGTTTI